MTVIMIETKSLFASTAMNDTRKRKREANPQHVAEENELRKPL